MDSGTDVSAAQTFDVSSFLGTLLNTGVAMVAANNMPSQQTGVPSATLTPSVRTNTSIGGMSQQTLTYIALGAAALVVVYLIAKK